MKPRLGSSRKDFQFLQKLKGPLGPGQVLDPVALDLFQVVHENQQGFFQAGHDGTDDGKNGVLAQFLGFQSAADFLQVQAGHLGNDHQHFPEQFGEEIGSVVQGNPDDDASGSFWEPGSAGAGARCFYPLPVRPPPPRWKGKTWPKKAGPPGPSARRNNPGCVFGGPGW